MTTAAIKMSGGVMVRVIEALNGFRTKYGYWPNALQIESRSIAALATELLTPFGFFLLQSRVELKNGYDIPELVAYGHEGDTFDYGKEGWTTEHAHDARAWLGLLEEYERVGEDCVDIDENYGLDDGAEVAMKDKPSETVTSSIDMALCKRIGELAYQGNWSELLAVLHENPQYVNTATESKGYTPLHQAAWHGAPSNVIGALLSLGANPTLRTFNKHQTPREIAEQWHEKHIDLLYLLSDRGRTLGQLIRKIVAERPDLFSVYDGNQVLCDRLIEVFNDDFACQNPANVEDRFYAAYKALMGTDLYSGQPISCIPAKHFEMQVSPDFWVQRFLPLLLDCASQSQVIPIERHWAVVSDLFDPAPDTWGFRGDLFLWMEMRQTLCHVPIPNEPWELAQLIADAFATLTGYKFDSNLEISVPRYDRGGMSSGMVSGAFWHDDLIPMLQQRARWLQQI